MPIYIAANGNATWLGKMHVHIASTSHFKLKYIRFIK